MDKNHNYSVLEYIWICFPNKHLVTSKTNKKFVMFFTRRESR